jgi:uncharacterized protein (TIGR02145 family)
MKLFFIFSITFLAINLHAQLPTWTHSGCKGIFAQTGKKSANNNNLWQEGNHQFTYEEISRSNNEVILQDMSGRGMQVKITANASYWKLNQDVNWNMLYSGVWVISPSFSNPLSSEQNCETSRKIYLESNIDVKNANLEPWVHYLIYGKKEGRKWPPCQGDMASITIGGKTWMSTNLDVDTFRNGDAIPEATSMEEWYAFGASGTPCWAYFSSNPINGILHGKLYNGFAVMDPRGLAPAGWHVATEQDWKELTGYRTDDPSAALYFGKLINAQNWNLDLINTNELKFNATPGGSVTINQEGEELTFDGLNEYAAWWTSTSANNGSSVKSVGINPIWYEPFDFNEFGLIFGKSVRCVKD